MIRIKFKMDWPSLKWRWVKSHHLSFFYFPPFSLIKKCMFDEMMSLSRTPLKTNHAFYELIYIFIDHLKSIWYQGQFSNHGYGEGILVNEDMHKGSYGTAPTPFNRVASLLCCFLQPLPFFFLTIFHLSF